MIDNVYNFVKGIPGFEDYRKFRLIEEKGVPFARLISVDEERIGFILIRPGLLFPDYGVEVDDDNAEVLKLNQVSEGSASIGALSDEGSNINVDIWSIVTLDRQDVAQSTVNLRAPILLNNVQKVGVQLILMDEKYLTKQPLIFDDAGNQGQEGAVD
ncbi:flagellar assembly factor FliW [Desulfosporosinus acididurans]|uniref:Flagellar assembly factor FliW n=1 Tax=Desulfosporosinus acididurans TaxID=476652 RepID=A0A0J1FRE1_9FIRM|nr:flagellar assembly protein FliW [Desulfosporosinus acididurans]KLU65882.1 flagellar assembly factor FliW [Desulfosporosinus acididurans]